MLSFIAIFSIQMWVKGVKAPYPKVNCPSIQNLYGTNMQEMALREIYDLTVTKSIKTPVGIRDCFCSNGKSNTKGW